jgi:hypothetical protein
VPERTRGVSGENVAVEWTDATWWRTHRPWQFGAGVGATQRISWQGHVGGLVTGALLAWAYVYPPRNNRNLIQAGATVAVVALFTLLIWWRTSDLVAEFGRHLGLG